MAELLGPDFEKHALIPAIAQDSLTGDVLMMAWMNREAYEETLRTIRECVLPLPSMAVSPGLRSSMPPGDDSVKPRSRAAASGSSLLKGDLDRITMKAIEKDRDQRYASVAVLAADIRRHINHEPVQAGPAAPLYRLKKLLRRRKSRVAVLSLAGGLLLLLTLSVVIGWSLLIVEEP